MVAGGWLTARLCIAAVSKASAREQERLVDEIRQRLWTVAIQLVVGPADRELDELDRFRAELRLAAGDGRTA